MHRSHAIWALLATLLVPLPFLFLTELSPNQQWLKGVWDSGHVPLFMLWTIASLHLIPLPRSAGLVTLRAVVLLAVAVVIEFIQLHTGREFSITDIFLDACGIAVGLRVGVPQLRQLPHLRRLVLDAVLVGCLAWGLQGAGTALFNRIYASVKFPQLWAADSLWPLKRVAGSSSRSMVNDENGEPLLKVLYGTETYSGFELGVMVTDWRQYRQLNISVMNPSQEPLQIICRIHDSQHSAHGSRVDDRFNRRVTLTHGWNAVSFDLQDVASAPASRRMQMDSITNVNCFTERLPQPRAVYYRAVWLE